jgi:CheY-like chemotaxis protein
MTIPKFRLLLIEDNQHRIDKIRSWLPEGCLLVVASSAGKAIGILQRDRGYVYGAVMLDHDLNEQALTESDLSLSGSDLVETLITHLSRDVPILVHSMNATRAPLVVQRLNRAGFEVTRLPFETLYRDAFLNWLEDARYNWSDAHGIQ